MWALNPTNPISAAIDLRNDDGEKIGFSQASKIAEEWSKHPEVMAERKRLIRAGILKDVLPTKDEFLLVLWDRLKQRISNEEFVKMGKLFADVSCYIEGGNGPNVTNFGQSNEQINERIDQLLKRRVDRVM